MAAGNTLARPSSTDERVSESNSHEDIRRYQPKQIDNIQIYCSILNARLHTSVTLCELFSIRLHITRWWSGGAAVSSIRSQRAVREAMIVIYAWMRRPSTSLLQLPTPNHIWITDTVPLRWVLPFVGTLLTSSAYLATTLLLGIRTFFVCSDNDIQVIKLTL